MISLSPACTGSSAGCRTAASFCVLGAKPRCDELRGSLSWDPARDLLGLCRALAVREAGSSSCCWRGSQGVDCVTFSSPTPRCVLQTYTQEDRLIVTQLPFLTTLVDFWALVWDYTCTSVVVLNQLQELDKVSSPYAALSSPSSP